MPIRGAKLGGFAVAAVVLLSGCSLFGVRSGYEAPAYTEIAALAGGIEIRRYGPRLAAETLVTGEDPDAAMNEGFRILAGYIFANDREGEEVAMTVPVEVEEASPRIEMTAPVETRTRDAGVAMRFFMPSRFTRETLPTPADDRVRIVEVPGETLAVLRFSGLGRSQTVAQRKAELLAAVAASRWRVEGAASVFYYDPPWTLPFLRRNEVVVPVAE